MISIHTCGVRGSWRRQKKKEKKLKKKTVDDHRWSLISSFIAADPIGVTFLLPLSLWAMITNVSKISWLRDSLLLCSAPCDFKMFLAKKHFSHQITLSTKQLMAQSSAQKLLCTDTLKPDEGEWERTDYMGKKLIKSMQVRKPRKPRCRLLQLHCKAIICRSVSKLIMKYYSFNKFSLSRCSFLGDSSNSSPLTEEQCMKTKLRKTWGTLYESERETSTAPTWRPFEFQPTANGEFKSSSTWVQFRFSLACKKKKKHNTTHETRTTEHFSLEKEKKMYKQGSIEKWRKKELKMWKEKNSFTSVDRRQFSQLFRECRRVQSAIVCWTWYTCWGKFKIFFFFFFCSNKGRRNSFEGRMITVKNEWKTLQKNRKSEII